MSLANDFDLHRNLRVESLKTLHNMPAGLPGQLAEVTPILAEYDAALAQIATNNNLSAAGKAEQIQQAYERATADVENWRAAKVNAVNAQTDTKRAALHSLVEKSLPTPTDVQVQNMAQRLSAFDPLEVEVLYADATDAERVIIEAAADAIGRQPRRLSSPIGSQVVWEHLLSPERVAAVREARITQVNPDGAMALRDLQVISNTYAAMAGAAAGLLRESVAGVAERVPVA